MKITALLHDCSADGETGYASTCIEFLEANGQGDSAEECLEDLRAAVHAVLEYRWQTAAAALGKGERLLLPPQSAVMSTLRGASYRFDPIRCHHRSIAATANSEVSELTPTVTPASLVAIS
jgi:predicted RNase H-like HicB family nuclease